MLFFQNQVTLNFCADYCPSLSQALPEVSSCEKRVFLPTVAKTFLIGVHLIVGVFSVLLQG